MAVPNTSIQPGSHHRRPNHPPHSCFRGCKFNGASICNRPRCKSPLLSKRWCRITSIRGWVFQRASLRGLLFTHFPHGPSRRGNPPVLHPGKHLAPGHLNLPNSLRPAYRPGNSGLDMSSSLRHFQSEFQNFLFHSDTYPPVSPPSERLICNFQCRFLPLNPGAYGPPRSRPPTGAPNLIPRSNCGKH